jgi:hypothetical protein
MEGSLVAYKVFTNGSVLNASEINDNLMNQSVMVFSNATARSAALTAPVEGMLTWLEDSNKYQYRNGSGAWVDLGGGGAILQVVSATSSTQVTNNSGTYVSTGLSASITPSSTSSKVMIFARTGSFSPNNGSVATFTIFRGTVAGTDLAGASGFLRIYTSVNTQIEGDASAFIIDSPNTTSSQTYTFAIKNAAGATGSVGAQYNGTLGSIILMEVAG